VARQTSDGSVHRFWRPLRRKSPAKMNLPLANGCIGATQRGPSLDAESLGLVSTRARACAASWNDSRHQESSGLRTPRPPRLRTCV
jgi:hypothetical protein